jgi:uncharacterized protein DUF6356
MTNIFQRLFVEHPSEVGESYFHHMGASGRYGFRLLKAAMCAFTHAVVPAMCKTSASDCVKEMAGELNGRTMVAREERMRRAGAYDPVI